MAQQVTGLCKVCGPWRYSWSRMYQECLCVPCFDWAHRMLGITTVGWHR